MTERITVQEIEARAPNTREVDLYREVLRTVAMFGDTNSRGLATAALAVWDGRDATFTSLLTTGLAPGDQTIRVADTTGWPTGDFLIVIDEGTLHEEWVRVDSREGTELAAAARGIAPTIACAHLSGATVSRFFDHGHDA